LLRDSRGGPFRQQIWVTLGGSSLDPLRDQIDLLLSQASVVLEFAEALHCAPGRHAAQKHFLFDGLRPWPRVFISCEGDVACVALNAALVDDARNFTRPREFGADDIVRQKRRRCSENQYG